VGPGRVSHPSRFFGIIFAPSGRRTGGPANRHLAPSGLRRSWAAGSNLDWGTGAWTLTATLPLPWRAVAVWWRGPTHGGTGGCAVRPSVPATCHGGSGTRQQAAFRGKLSFLPPGSAGGVVGKVGATLVDAGPGELLVDEEVVRRIKQRSGLFRLTGVPQQRKNSETGAGLGCADGPLRETGAELGCAPIALRALEFLFDFQRRGR
jgi:hypothetical protein